MSTIYPFLVFALLPAVLGKIRYDGYQVYRIVPETPEQVQVVQDLENFGVKFWKGPAGFAQPSDILVAPHQMTLIQGLRVRGFQVSEFIPNVQKLIDQQRVSDSKAGTKMTWTDYSTLEQITDWLKEIARNNSDIATLVTIGKSYEGRDLHVLKISRSNDSKPIVFLEANAHAREWITSAVATFTINEFVSSARTNISNYLEDFDVYVLPFLNPDGFAFSHTEDRLWRKTRSNTTSSLGCKGADPNRNFDFQWLGGGSSTNPCSETYAGPRAASEPEVKALSDYLLTIADRLVFYYGIHSYGHYLLIPYGHTRDPIPEYDEYMRIGTKVAAAIERQFGKVFTPGNVVDLLYVASAEGFDWVKGVINPYISMEIELRDQGRYGFLLPPDEIIPSGLEFIDGLAVFLEEVKTGTANRTAAATH